MFLPTTSPTAAVFLAVFAIGSITSVGTAAVSLAVNKSKLNLFETLVYGVAAGIVIHGGVGAVVGLFNAYNQAVAIALLSTLNAFALAYLWRIAFFKRLLDEKTFGLLVGFGGWVCLTVLCIVLSFISIKFPERLVDGPYVIKNHNLHVKIQAMTGHLPADNYVPLRVQRHEAGIVKALVVLDLDRIDFHPAPLR